jgi:hypothetical protein
MNTILNKKAPAALPEADKRKLISRVTQYQLSFLQRGYYKNGQQLFFSSLT